MAKTETSQCIEMFNVPRIPIMQRWAQRFARLAKANLDGVHPPGGSTASAASAPTK